MSRSRPSDARGAGTARSVGEDVRRIDERIEQPVRQRNLLRTRESRADALAASEPFADGCGGELGRRARALGDPHLAPAAAAWFCVAESTRELYDRSPWMAFAVLGIATVLAASLLERHHRGLRTVPWRCTRA
jgi:hypothetical protein